MNSKLKKFVLGILALLLTGCALNKSGIALNDSKLNQSALYDPPTVHLVPGTVYHFQEGDLTGTGQMFHSHFSYMRALVIGTPAAK